MGPNKGAYTNFKQKSSVWNTKIGHVTEKADISDIMTV